jgi:hypothetical protein
MYHAIRNAAQSNQTLEKETPANFDHPFPSKTDDKKSCPEEKTPCYLFLKEVHETANKLQAKYDDDKAMLLRHVGINGTGR